MVRAVRWCTGVGFRLAETEFSGVLNKPFLLYSSAFFSAELSLDSGVVCWCEDLPKLHLLLLLGLTCHRERTTLNTTHTAWINLHFIKDRLIRLCHSFTMKKEGGGGESGESYRNFKRWKFSNRIWIFCDIFGGVLVLWRWPERLFDSTKPCPLLPHSHTSQWQLAQSPARHDTFE